MRIIYGVLVGFCIWFFSIQNVKAFEVSLSSGFVHLPSSSYHYLGYDLGLGFGSVESHFDLNIGLTHPYYGYGYSQKIFFGRLGWTWALTSSWIKPYVGVGLGTYADIVSSSGGVIPSIVTHGGLKLGGNGFGADLSLATYMGIYNPAHLVNFTMWPLVTILGGIYAVF